MARDRIVFAMANPVPEIQPEEAERYVARDGHRAVRLSEPDQQRAVLPRFLPRPPRLAGARRQRRDEDRRGPRHRRVREPAASSGRSTSFRASSTRAWRRRSPGEVVRAAQRTGVGAAPSPSRPRLRWARERSRGRPREAHVIARRAQEIEPFLAVEVFQRAQPLEAQAGADVDPPRVRRAGLRHARRRSARPPRRPSRTGALATRTPWGSCRFARPSPSTTGALRGDRLARADRWSPRARRRRCCCLFSDLLDRWRRGRALRSPLRVLPEVHHATRRRCRVYVPVAEDDGVPVPARRGAGSAHGRGPRPS